MLFSLAKHSLRSLHEVALRWCDTSNYFAVINHHSLLFLDPISSKASIVLTGLRMLPDFCILAAISTILEYLTWRLVKKSKESRRKKTVACLEVQTAI